MKTTLGAFLLAIALWAQAPQPDAAATKGKGNPAAKGKGIGGAPQAAKAPTPPPVPQVLRLLRPHLYLVTGHGTNTVFRVTPQGVIVVDTKTANQGDYERLVELIRGVAPAPVRFVFNASFRADAVGNNARFQAAGAELVSAEHAVTVGGVDVRAVRMPEGDAIYFATDKVICLGDVYSSGNAAAFDAALKLDWTLAVPSIGEPLYRTAVEAKRTSLK